MAAPTFVGAGTGATITTTSGAVTPGGVTVNDGDLLILQVLQDGISGTLTLTAITGIEDLTGTDNAMSTIGVSPIYFAFPGLPAARHYLWFGRKIAGASTLTVTVNTSGDDLYCRLYVFRNVKAGTTFFLGANDIAENSGLASILAVADSGSTAAITDRAITTTDADRLAVTFVAVNDDNAVGPFTGMTGGTWAEAVAEYLDATGTDGCIQLQTATIASAGTIDGGSYTMAAADNWSVVGFALLPAASGPTTWNSSAAVSLTDTRVTAGTKQTFTTTTLALANVRVTAGTRKTFSSAAVALSTAVTSGGVVRKLGAAAAQLTVGLVTAGVRKTFAVAAAALQNVRVAAGTVTTGPVTHQGAATVALTNTRVTAGTRRTTSNATVALTNVRTTAGTRRTFGQIARDETVAVTTTPAPPGTKTGAAAVALTASVTTAATRGTFGSTATHETALVTTTAVSVGAASITTTFFAGPRPDGNELAGDLAADLLAGIATAAGLSGVPASLELGGIPDSDEFAAPAPRRG